MTVPSLTPLPTAPARTDPPATFITRADAFLAALVTLQSEMNTSIGAFNTDAAQVNTDATNAATSATNASSSASAAAVTAGAALWVSGQSYSSGDAAISGVDYQTYRANTATSGTTDPSSSADWVQLSGYSEAHETVTSSSGTTTVNLTDAYSFQTTLSENTTFSFTNPPASGKQVVFILKIIQDASASGYTVSWPASVDWELATAPTLTATANAVDVFIFYTTDGGTTYYGFTAGKGMA